MRPVLSLVVAFVVGLGACGGGGSPDRTLTVYAASSLTEPIAAIAAAYEAVIPGLTLTIATDASAALAAQIRQGAPADVFLSADATTPRALRDDGLTTGAIVPFALNALAIVVPTNNPAAIRTPADLALPGVRIIAAGGSVPITRYATQLVTALGDRPEYPSDFSDRYLANVVSREDNVRAVLAKLALGEGDAGIVYVTDARSSDRVETVTLPEGSRVTATYDGVVLRSAASSASAAAFLDWLAGPEGQAILVRFGFEGPS